MADALLSSSIASLKTKILSQVTSATIIEVAHLARSAKQIGLGDDTDIETAFNSRVNQLYSTATPADIKILAGAIKQLKNDPTVSSLITNSDDITEGSLNTFHTTARVNTQLGAFSTNIVPDGNVTRNVGSAGNKLNTVFTSTVTGLTTPVNADDAANKTYVDNAITSAGGANLSAVAEHIIPTTDITYDLGSSTNKFRDLYLSGNTLNLGTQTLSSDSTGIIVPELTIGTGTNKIKMVAKADGTLETTGTNSGGTTTSPVKSLTAADISTFVEQSDIDTSIANLVDTAPATLNTLNELAAALGDDANFSTTITNSVAAKLPLAGGTMTGAIDMGSNDITTTGKIKFANVYSTEADLPSASTYHGMFAHVHSTGAGYFAHAGSWVKLASETYVGNQITAAGSYSDASVDSHLNRSTATTGQTLIWNGTDYSWGAPASTVDISGKQDKNLLFATSEFTDDNVSVNISTQVNSQGTTGAEGLTFSPDGTKMYVSTQKPYVYQYTLSTKNDVSSASYANKSLHVQPPGGTAGANTPNPMAIRFSPDGTEFFIALENDYWKIVRYTCSTAFDISTATYASDFLSIAPQFGNGSYGVGGMEISPDGTKIAIMNLNQMKIVQYDLSTAFDLSSGSYNNVEFSLNGKTSYPYGMAFNSDGTLMHVIGQTDQAIHSYILSTAYDIATMTATGKISTSVGLISGSSSPRTFMHGNGNLAFSGDFTKIYVLEDHNNYPGSGIHVVHQFTSGGKLIDIVNAKGTSNFDGAYSSLTGAPAAGVTQSDIDTSIANLVDSAPATLDTLNELAAALGDDANFSTTITTSIASKATASSVSAKQDKVYANFDYSWMNNTTNTDTAYYSSQEFNILTSYNSTYGGIVPGEWNSVEISPDGTKIWACHDRTNLGSGNWLEMAVHQWTLTTPYDTSTMSNHQRQTFSASAGGASPRGNYRRSIRWQPDGMKFYLVDWYYGIFYSYEVSTAFDVTTKGTQDFTNPSSALRIAAFDYNADGTKMFAVQMGDVNDHRQILEYNLSTPYDITTATDAANASWNYKTTFPSLDWYTVKDMRIINSGKTVIFANYGTTNGSHLIKLTLTTPYDFSTMSSATANTIYTSTMTGPSLADNQLTKGLAVSSDGTSLYALGKYQEISNDPMFVTRWKTGTTLLEHIATKGTSNFDGAYSSLTGTPTVPTNNNQLTNGAGYITSVPAQSFASLTSKPTTIAGYGITDAGGGGGNVVEYTSTTTAAPNDAVMLNSNGTVTPVAVTTYANVKNVPEAQIIANSDGWVYNKTYGAFAPDSDNACLFPLGTANKYFFMGRDESSGSATLSGAIVDWTGTATFSSGSQNGWSGEGWNYGTKYSGQAGFGNWAGPYFGTSEGQSTERPFVLPSPLDSNKFLLIYRYSETNVAAMLGTITGSSVAFTNHAQGSLKLQNNRPMRIVYDPVNSSSGSYAFYCIGNSNSNGTIKIKRGIWDGNTSIVFGPGNTQQEDFGWQLPSGDYIDPRSISFSKITANRCCAVTKSGEIAIYDLSTTINSRTSAVTKGSAQTLAALQWDGSEHSGHTSWNYNRDEFVVWWRTGGSNNDNNTNMQNYELSGTTPIPKGTSLNIGGNHIKFSNGDFEFLSGSNDIFTTHLQEWVGYGSAYAHSVGHRAVISVNPSNGNLTLIDNDISISHSTGEPGVTTVAQNNQAQFEGTISVDHFRKGQGAMAVPHYHNANGTTWQIAGSPIQGSFVNSNIDATKIHGLSGSTGTTIDVTVEGGIHTGLSGLTAGTAYFVLEDGTLSATADTNNARLGIAMTSTSLAVDLVNELTSTSLATYATKSYVDTATANLVDSAPATLNTLNELAAALGDDTNFSTTITNSIATKANTSSLHAIATSGAYSDLTGTPAAVDISTKQDKIVAYDFANASYSTTSTNSYSSYSGRQGFAFNTTGTKLILTQAQGGGVGIVSFNLTTAWDLSTISASPNVTSTSPVLQDGNGSPLYQGAISADGTVFVGYSNAAGRHYEYKFGTPFDITTMTSSGNSGTNAMTNGHNFFIKPGTYDTLYVIEGGVLYQWTFTGNSIVTGTLTQGNSVNLGSANYVNSGQLQFRPDGTEFYIAQETNDIIEKWVLSTAWDITTATKSADSISIGTSGGNIWLKPDGTRIYHMDVSDNFKVDEYKIGGVLLDIVNSKATQSYVTTQITNLVDSAPGALDTLNELAAALGDDAAFSTTVTNSIATKLPLAGGTMTGDIDGGGNKVMFANVYSALGDLPSASTYHGMFAHVHATGKGYYAHAGAWIELANQSDLSSVTGGATTSDTAPASPSAGDLWFKSDTADLFLYYTDADSSQWVQVGGAAQSTSGSGVQSSIETGNTSITTTDTGSDGTILFTTEGTARWEITSSGNLLPKTNAAFDIGSASYKVRDLYLDDSTIHLGDTPLSASNIDRSMEIYTDVAAPSSATDTGAKGDVRIVGNYMYVCINTNEWVRTQIETSW